MILKSPPAGPHCEDGGFYYLVVFINSYLVLNLDRWHVKAAGVRTSNPLLSAVTRSEAHLSVDPDKLPRVAFSPRRQDDVSQLGTILFGAWDEPKRNNNHCIVELRLIHSAPVWYLSVVALTQVKVVGVEQELRQVEELGDELLHVGHVVFWGGKPGLAHAVEHPVGQVEVTPLVVTWCAHRRLNTNSVTFLSYQGFTGLR